MTHEQAPVDFWENFYQERDRIWSGHANAVLVSEATAMAPGRALDLGCGEGGDSLWLAEQGWSVTGLDISVAALDRARGEAERRGVGGRISFQQQDLADWSPAERYDLVSAHFLQSPVHLPRDYILRRAADAVAPGGVLLVVEHGEMPPWADVEQHHHGPQFASPEEIRDLIGLGSPDWQILSCEKRSRPVTAPDGSASELVDSVVLARLH